MYIKKNIVSDKVDYCILDKNFTDSSHKYCPHRHRGTIYEAEISRNRSNIALIFGSKAVVTLRQVHSSRVVDIVSKSCALSKFEGDAMITDRSKLVLAVLTADCVPVLLSCNKGTAVAALHCGWRGAKAGIIENTVERLLSKYRVNQADLVGIVGPSIMQKSYQVDERFYADFLSDSSDNERYFITISESSKFLFDLPGYVIDKLVKAGVKVLEYIAEDTYSNCEKYPSRRRAAHHGTEYNESILSAIAIS